MQNSKFKIQNGGFTLIEIIVSISIFTVVMMITLGALLNLNDSSRKAQALRTVIDNLNFAVEDMTRKIRTGDIYHCYDKQPSYAPAVDELGAPRPCLVVAGGALSVKTQELDKISGKNTGVWAFYYLSKDYNGVGRIMYKRSISGGGVNLDGGTTITSPDVDINTLEFHVVGTGTSPDNSQPMVILNITGVVDLAKEKLKTDFSLQTAISRRKLN